MTTLTTAQQVRGRIQDQPQRFDEQYAGDGLRADYEVQVGNARVTNLISATAYIVAGGIWSATGATFDASGFVTFNGVISANTAYRVVGVQSVFSEAEIGHFTAVGGSVAGAALEAVNWLRFDALKRARWFGADGTQYDDTAAIKAVEKLYDDLRQELIEAESDTGGFESWALNQDDVW